VLDLSLTPRLLAHGGLVGDRQIGKRTGVLLAFAAATILVGFYTYFGAVSRPDLPESPGLVAAFVTSPDS
jgi:hypothetical protein